jgi:hypothetical protein
MLLQNSGVRAYFENAGVDLPNKRGGNHGHLAEVIFNLFTQD